MHLFQKYCFTASARDWTRGPSGAKREERSTMSHCGRVEPQCQGWGVLGTAEIIGHLLIIQTCSQPVHTQTHTHSFPPHNVIYRCRPFEDRRHHVLPSLICFPFHAQNIWTAAQKMHMGKDLCHIYVYTSQNKLNTGYDSGMYPIL